MTPGAGVLPRYSIVTAKWSNKAVLKLRQERHTR